MIKSISFGRKESDVYCGIVGMSPGEFVEIVTNYFKSFDKRLLPSKYDLGNIFKKVKDKNQGFSRSIIIKTAQEYFQNNIKPR